MNINIRYGQVDPEAKNDSAPTVNNAQPWSSMADLRKEINAVNIGNFATCEHNQAILDGSQTHFPDNTADYGWGWWSLAMSNDQGQFGGVVPTLDITFGVIHKGKGLTLHFYPFSDDYADRVRVTWYAANLTTVLHTGIYTFKSNICVVNQIITDFRRIKIEFLSTNIRNRHLKLWGIDYGIIRTFEDSDINTASILEEISPISEVISVNTLGFQIKTHNPEFSHISGNLEDDMLMKKQALTVTANGKPFGLFFLDAWKDALNTGTTFDFSAIDAIGVMEQYEFMGGMYSNMLAKDIIQQLFEICFPTQIVWFRLDDDLANARATGYLPISTCRESFQQICFAIGAVADTSRRDYVWIYKKDTDIAFDIPLENIYRGGSNEPTPYVSGVDLLSYEYQAGAEAAQAHDGTLPAGDHEVRFSEPLHTLTITGGTIISSGTNYANIRVATQGTVTLTGRRYIVNNLIHSVRTDIAAGEVQSIVTFDKCTLVDRVRAETLKRELYAYVAQRLKNESELRLGDLECGYVAKLATYGRPIIGTIEKLDIRLRGGRAKAKVIGNVDTTGI